MIILIGTTLQLNNSSLSCQDSLALSFKVSCYFRLNDDRRSIWVLYCSPVVDWNGLTIFAMWIRKQFNNVVNNVRWQTVQPSVLSIVLLLFVETVYHFLLYSRKYGSMKGFTISSFLLETKRFNHLLYFCLFWLSLTLLLVILTIFSIGFQWKSPAPLPVHQGMYSRWIFDWNSLTISSIYFVWHAIM